VSISKFNKAKISGIVTCVPENFRKIDDDIDVLYNGNIKQVNRIKKSIGLDKRHIADPNVTTSDLCEMAAINLLMKMDINKEKIGAIIVVTQTPDYFQPASASYLHGILNLPECCAAFDVNQGCTGYVYGLWLAFMMIETESCQNVLLLVGDTLSKVVNSMDSNVASLFGDAGTATLIEKSNSDKKSFFTLNTNGKKFDTIIQPKGAFREPTSKHIHNEKVFDVSEKRGLGDLYMDGAEVFNFSLEKEPKAIKYMLKLSNSSMDDIDYIVFHQANKYIISNIVRRLGIHQDKAPSETTGKYGNQSSASIPSTICDSLRSEVENKSIKVILSGFGVGLSWGNVLLDIEKIYCPEILFYN
jgi:3-oxoacyl-[acyl-carrier-protein] synthase III